MEDAAVTMNEYSSTFLSAEYFRTTKFGSLRMLNPMDSSRGSHRKTEWQCDCGRTTIVAVCSVVSGNTLSCRKCGLLLADTLHKTKYGNLRMVSPCDMMPGSRKKVLWDCDCGRQRSIKFYDVVRGHTTTCGRCSMLSTEHFRTTKFGSLKMISPNDFHLSSHEEVEWLCDCGQVTIRQVGLVTSGHTSSCGKCNLKTQEYWALTEFGHLTMSKPETMSPGSNQEIEWKCRCGGTLVSNVYSVTSGRTVRCGLCRSKVTDWYTLNKNTLRSLKTPFQASEIPSGWITALESVRTHSKPFRAKCGACGSEYTPRWGNIVRGSSLTCGCVSNHVSGGQREIANWLENLDLDVEIEHRIGIYKYDLYIPSVSLLIEYHGLRWHSNPGSKHRDLIKYQNAVENGYDFIAVFEDEWIFGRDKVKQLLKNRVLQSKVKSVRPSSCEIRSVSHQDVTPFYDKFHYIGTCRAKVHYGVFLDNEMIAAASFGHPTRQSNHEWELLRMASDSDHRIHGIWSKILTVFISNYRPSSIVSFSDNRLFNGRTYKKIGFKLDGELRPDYYWVKGQKRFHKSGLRKKGVEKTLALTEGQLRESQGYRRIWDLGKKRWVINLANSEFTRGSIVLNV